MTTEALKKIDRQQAELATTTILVRVVIEGTSGLLQHAFGVGALDSRPDRPVVVQNATPRAQAEEVAYRNAKGECYFPGTWIGGTIKEAASSRKMKGSRKTARYIVPSAVIVQEVDIPMLAPDGKTRLTDFEVDSRPVTIPATKGRIMRHRPRFDEWRASFTLRINTKLLPEDLVHAILNDAGEQIGIGDFRPAKGGPFGCFRVVAWDRI